MDILTWWNFFLLDFVIIHAFAFEKFECCTQGSFLRSFPLVFKWKCCHQTYCVSVVCCFLSIICICFHWWNSFSWNPYFKISIWWFDSTNCFWIFLDPIWAGFLIAVLRNATVYGHIMAYIGPYQRFSRYVSDQWYQRSEIPLSSDDMICNALYLKSWIRVNTLELILSMFIWIHFILYVGFSILFLYCSSVQWLYLTFFIIIGRVYFGNLNYIVEAKS